MESIRSHSVTLKNRLLIILEKIYAMNSESPSPWKFWNVYLFVIDLAPLFCCSAGKPLSPVSLSRSLAPCLLGLIWLISCTFLTNEQYFFLTLNQSTVLLAMAYQPNKIKRTRRRMMNEWIIMAEKRKSTYSVTCTTAPEARCQSLAEWWSQAEQHNHKNYSIRRSIQDIICNG